MKTQTASATPATFSTPKHLFAMALGILAAVMCSFVFLQSTSGEENENSTHIKNPALYFTGKSAQVHSPITIPLFRRVVENLR